MADYWQERYSQAIASAELALTPETRSTFRRLAHHCALMRDFCERNDYQLAA